MPMLLAQNGNATFCAQPLHKSLQTLNAIVDLFYRSDHTATLC